MPIFSEAFFIVTEYLVNNGYNNGYNIDKNDHYDGHLYFEMFSGNFDDYRIKNFQLF